MHHDHEKSEYLKLREHAGLTRAEAAELVKVGEHTAYRYETGKSRPPKLVIHTLRERARNSEQKKPEAFRFAELFAGIGGLRIGFESIGGKCVFAHALG
jgi:DNA (cytosine-5)-methyltransferase 1